ncbi:MAG TPA: TetR/AcrR family transcriptional regulator, partial [Solirubrobacteraceae bacterium]|nr:TetR/AcrR family transcriptional regulator [Solirubrobacteraceae bacterium]
REQTVATSTTRKRRTRADGERSYQLIVNAAARLATIEGLEGLSIGRLADEIGMSKSGLYAHFDSKQDLQLAAIDAAEAVYDTEVVAPAMQAPEGVKRLELLCDRYLSYVERGVFPGGCFFAATAAEWDTRRGPIRQRVRAILDGWTKLVEANLRQAQEQGDLQPGADPHQISFEINALLHEANGHYLLFRDTAALDRARTAIRDRLAHPGGVRASGRPRAVTPRSR